MMIPVKGHRDLCRDEISNAIINTDANVYGDYLRIRNKSLSDKYRITQLEDELVEIKNLLQKLLKDT